MQVWAEEGWKGCCSCRCGQRRARKAAAHAGVGRGGLERLLLMQVWAEEGWKGCCSCRCGQRRARKAAAHAGVGATAMPFTCDTCQRTFRRRQDISRHRCVTTHHEAGADFD